MGSSEMNVAPWRLRGPARQSENGKATAIPGVGRLLGPDPAESSGGLLASAVQLRPWPQEGATRATTMAVAVQVFEECQRVCLDTLGATMMAPTMTISMKNRVRGGSRTEK
mmetsp:Transcript_55416/g.119193  ORF Transcript_55416/g.119193 Transcript_55416/m.119193 type:complete len:111 (+) Transcript_55416:1137-1469(+)